MTTLSKEDVVRWEAEADKFKTGEFTDTLDLKSFATLARADLVAENERLNGYIKTVDNLRAISVDAANKAWIEIDQLRTALAAAEAREEKLRDALDNHSGNYKLSKDECAKLNALLDAPRDDSALREMIAGVYEECAKVCDDLHDQWKWSIDDPVSGPSECRDAIRALAAAEVRHGN